MTSVTALDRSRFNRAVRAACDKSNEGEQPECHCHYPQCQEDGFYCFMMIHNPKEAAVLIEEWEKPQRLGENRG